MHATTTIPVEVILLPEHCYRCGRVTSPVAGLRIVSPGFDGDDYEMLEEGGWFLEYGHGTAAIIATVCADAILDAHGAGPLRWRTTRLVPDGYLANTCHHCGAVLGNWPLHDAWLEYQAEGGTLDELPRFASTIDESALVEL
jgi:hypothetical protein